MGREVYKVLVPPCDTLLTASDTKIIMGSTFIGTLGNFAVTVVSCATQVIDYRIQFSPIDNADYFVTAGPGQTATSVAIGSGVKGITTNVFTNNYYGYVRVEVSAACKVNDTPMRVYIHGIREE